MKPFNPAGVRSMTGQGHASDQSDLGTITVEVRTVNNRGFKCSSRISDSLSALDNKIETLARSLIHRGSVTLSISWRKPDNQDAPAVNREILKSYAQHLQQVRQELDDPSMTIELASLMTLPGVFVTHREDRRKDDELWAFVRGAIKAAIANLDRMRESEGQNMATTLRTDVQQIRQSLDQISILAPRAVETYRNRLETKIERILTERAIETQPVDLLREVQIYADRADISEEIMRLGSHLEMFQNVLDGTDNSDHREPTGRKLDFVIQEMFRETNTIGSKASDAEVSANVVEIKCAIERMRELVQNLE
ncbi:Conserved hypothetical protein CHP00255 [Rubripirellula lacrimiformis]|uniref:YicC family protein n=1 Tax=Rubripirellula lacrimiformis TaxID=1930273 RepID=A0A517NLB5_9BACT|nr:YicC/YloC family endoribonuclease [Rubripirellula lacrimiformis]QDT07926.1 Conserved hypothetical protein CHP00255 [Rubripirellula lacrimiformis]